MLCVSLFFKLELEEEKRKLNEPFWISIYEKFCQPYFESMTWFLSSLEVFIANLPLTIGAVGLSWVTMGTFDSYVRFGLQSSFNCRRIWIHFRDIARLL